MYAWADGRPRRCVKVGADAVAWAETQRNWRGRRRHRCAVSPIPDGAVKPSPADLNLADVGMLEGRLRTLAGPAPSWRIGKRVLAAELPRPIVLLLPDAAVRAVVLHLDQLPSRREEREALIRWRLGQEQLFPLAGAKVVSQVYEADPAAEGRGRTVLAVAIQESVLQQYETLCETAGLIPREVGITSFRLFDLWRRVSGGTQWQRRDLLWVNLADRALTTMVFQRGHLVFYRCKLLGAEAAQVAPKSEILHKIVEECGASLDACQQRHPTTVVKEAIVCADGDLPALQAQIETDLELSVEPMGWRSVETLGWVARGSQPGMASLSAVAGLC